jgi:four helix bundle protein
MKYERFEDLPAWKTAIELGLKVYRLTQDRFFHPPGDLLDQLRRALLSVSNNTAEGFERGSTAALLACLYIAKGSAGEACSALCFTERFPETGHLKAQIAECKALAESCSRQIRAWADDLQNCDLKGQRHLNDQSRRQDEECHRAEAFQKQLDDLVRRARPQDHPEASNETPPEEI